MLDAEIDYVWCTYNHTIKNGRFLPTPSFIVVVGGLAVIVVSAKITGDLNLDSIDDSLHRFWDCNQKLRGENSAAHGLTMGLFADPKTQSLFF